MRHYYLSALLACLNLFVGDLLDTGLALRLLAGELLAMGWAAAALALRLLAALPPSLLLASTSYPRHLSSSACSYGS